MKKLNLFITSLLILFTINVNAAFEEGKNYTTLDLPKSEKPTVTEYFSLYCPHCFEFEPMISKVSKQLPVGTVFDKEHVSFMGAAMGSHMSRAFFTMKLLGLQDKLVPIMFNRIHVLNKAPKDDAEMKQFFLDNGVSASDFDGTYSSFITKTMANKADQGFKDHGLDGVPSLIVNNNILVNLSSVRDQAELLALLDQLLKPASVMDTSAATPATESK